MWAFMNSRSSCLQFSYYINSSIVVFYIIVIIEGNIFFSFQYIAKFAETLLSMDTNTIGTKFTTPDAHFDN